MCYQSRVGLFVYCSVAQSGNFAAPWTAACQASPSFTMYWSLLRLMSIALMMPSNHLILSPPPPPALNLSQHQVFYSDGSSHQVSKGLELQFQHQSFQWMFRVDFFGIDWLDPFAVQGTLKSFSGTTVQRHQFFSAQPSLVQLSHPYMTTGKTIALTRWTFVGELMYLFFNTLSRIVIAFLPSSKHLLISWVQSCSQHLQWFWSPRK